MMNKNIYTVSALNQYVKHLLEADIGRVKVTGEISNFTHQKSGHMYFSLKDENAQISATLFKSINQRLNFKPENGMAVEATGMVSLYPQRGTYQINISGLKKAGEGNLQVKFEALKAKLQQEGLFELERKQAIPKYCQRVGVITSPTGAVINDIKEVLKRRAPWLEILIYPSQVQGELAKDALAEMIALANQRNECDVLIIARGGGSIEDLWPFNEERVARAIANSALPIISAVGHQTDFTIADFVADVRAATPSEAAEKVAPDSQQLLERVAQQKQRLQAVLGFRLKQLKNRLENSARLIRSPQSKLQDAMQMLDEKSKRLQRSQTFHINKQRQQLAFLKTRLEITNPQKQLNQSQNQLDANKAQLIAAFERHIAQQKNKIQQLSHDMNLVNPKAILARGYSITLDETGQAVKSAKALKKGQTLTTLVEQGKIESTVLNTEE